MVETVAKREKRQDEFLKEVQSYHSGYFTVSFTTLLELKEQIIKAVHHLDLSLSAASIDESELLERADSLISGASSFSDPTLSISLAFGPKQQLLRPSEIESKELAQKISKKALFDDTSLFEISLGTQNRLEKGRLILEQDGGKSSISINEQGDIVVRMPAKSRDRNFPQPALSLIEEEVQAKLQHGLMFASWLIDDIDPMKRITDSVLLVGLTGAGYLGWSTKKEAAETCLGRRNTTISRQDCGAFDAGNQKAKRH